MFSNFIFFYSKYFRLEENYLNVAGSQSSVPVRGPARPYLTAALWAVDIKSAEIIGISEKGSHHLISFFLLEKNPSSMLTFSPDLVPHKH